VNIYINDFIFIVSPGQTYSAQQRVDLTSDTDVTISDHLRYRLVDILCDVVSDKFKNHKSISLFERLERPADPVDMMIQNSCDEKEKKMVSPSNLPPVPSCMEIVDSFILQWTRYVRRPYITDEPTMYRQF
jgi:hypothetical protein